MIVRMIRRLLGLGPKPETRLERVEHDLEEQASRSQEVASKLRNVSADLREIRAVEIIARR